MTRTKFAYAVLKSAFTSFLAFGVMSATTSAGDLSRYRNFQFGADLATVANQAGVKPSEATAIHRRPALIQELRWSPQPLSSSQPESAKEVVFGFYDGELYRIAVTYDRYATEGMTDDDLLEAITATYGPAAIRTSVLATPPGRYGDHDDVVARWQDSDYSFELLRSSIGPTFRLIGVLKRLEVSVQAATVEAARLDQLDAPQREAARLAVEKETERAKQEKARLVNKPKFRT